jgi:hypothetical protein
LCEIFLFLIIYLAVIPPSVGAVLVGLKVLFLGILRLSNSYENKLKSTKLKICGTITVKILAYPIVCLKKLCTFGVPFYRNLILASPNLSKIFYKQYGYFKFYHSR